MSGSDEILASAIAGAQYLVDGLPLNIWKGFGIELKFDDPLSLEEEPASTAVPRRTLPGNQLTDTGSVPIIDLHISIGEPQNQRALVPEPTFGAVLAEVFLKYSILSKQDGPVRLEPISRLNCYPVLGYGKSFIARQVPASIYRHIFPDLGGEEHVVIKSLRHRELNDTNPRIQDERVPRLQNFLRELHILTHNPLRNHDNIVRLIGVGWERNRLSKDSVFYWPFLVLEHARYGTLIDLLEEDLVEFNTRRDLCLDVGLGLHALHKCDVIHGDIKPENVLVFYCATRKYVAKIADFGYSVVDLEGSSPTTRRLGYTAPWEAPDSTKCLSFANRKLTDVYSYGFLLWRAVSYGHYPFDQRNGMISSESTIMIERLKDTDRVPEFAVGLLKSFLDESLFTAIKLALEYTVVHSPEARNLEKSITALNFVGAIRSSSSMEPIRSTNIPSEQGLGIYAYGSRNMRLDILYLLALESHYLYAKQLKQNISLNSKLLVQHGSATLFEHFLKNHVSGDVKDTTHITPTLAAAFLFLQLSASVTSLASAEAILPIAKAFDCESLIIDSKIGFVAAYALYRGLEFILRDAMVSELPGKLEFLDAFTTKCCRGAGIQLSIAKDIFDGTGARYGEFMSKPFYVFANPDPASPDGIIDADYLLRVAAGWGALKDIQVLVAEYGASVNTRDWHGETALLKACRAGHLDVVRWLVNEAGALANVGSKKNVTPLHWLNSFPKDQIREITMLLHSAKGDPNAVMTEEFGGSEGEFWFFKGPPLMRVVAFGNLEAVQGLLEVGADPLITRIESKEHPFTFAVRRARLDILKAIVQSIGTDVLWNRDFSGIRPIYYILSTSASYLAKIHLDRFGLALIEVFDYFWSLEEPDHRQFYTIDGKGRIAIQVAIANGNFSLVKRIVETCPSSGHLKELLVTIGMQTAILEGRYAMFKYLLENGGLALHPVLHINPEDDSQFENYVTCGPWTQDLAKHQLKTNSLHLCAQAGEYAEMMCNDLLKSILPASRWDNTPEHLRQQNIINCSCEGPVQIDPIVDSRNELGETPFFCALRAEEYEMALALYQAGASQNVTIPHRAVSRQGLRVLPSSDESLPLAEHVLTWTSAYNVLHFIIKDCWGCLRLTNSYGDQLRTCVIEETATWPLDEAFELFQYIKERSYSGFTWDKNILHAIIMRNQAVVSTILQEREKLIPTLRRPQALYDAVRESILIAHKRPGRHRTTAMDRLTKIIEMIKNHYPEHPLGGESSVDFGDMAIEALKPEILGGKKRYMEGLIGLQKLEDEFNRQLFPWLVCALRGNGPFRVQPLVLIETFLQGILGNATSVKIDMEKCQITLTTSVGKVQSPTPSIAKTVETHLLAEVPRASKSIFGRKNFLSLRTVLRSRKT